MKYEGAPSSTQTEQELNTVEMQIEPETAARISVDAFKKWKAEKAEEQSESETEVEPTEEPEAETVQEPGVAEETQESEVEYVTPRVLSPEEAKERQRQREADAKARAKEVADLNQEFIRRKPFLKDIPFWEEDLEFSWQILQDYIKRAKGLSMEDEARMEESAFFTYDTGTLHETIEAQSGHFFRERARALRDAINASDLTEAEKKAQLDKIDALWENAVKHLEFKNMYPEEIRGYGADYYERSRTRVHNATITSLNELNDLARSYKLKPFTPRNFWTSDVRNQTPEMQRRMRYDRDLVEEYYAIAFERELADEKSKANDQFSGFYGGSDY
jgi:hypothetical protein